MRARSAAIEVLEAFQLLPDRWGEIAYGVGIAVAVAAFGRNLLDPGCRAPSARAGYAQAATVLADVAAVWG